MYRHFQENRAPSCIAVSWEDKYHTPKHPLLLLYLRTAFITEHMSYGMEYSLGQLGSAVLALFPPSFLCTLNHLVGRAAPEAETALALWEPCFAAAETLVCYQRYFILILNPKHSTIAAAGKKMNSVLAKTRTSPELVTVSLANVLEISS